MGDTISAAMAAMPSPLLLPIRVASRSIKTETSLLPTARTAGSAKWMRLRSAYQRLPELASARSTAIVGLHLQLHYSVLAAWQWMLPEWFGSRIPSISGYGVLRPRTRSSTRPQATAIHGLE